MNRIASTFSTYVCILFVSVPHLYVYILLFVLNPHTGGLNIFKRIILIAFWGYPKRPRGRGHRSILSTSFRGKLYSGKICLDEVFWGNIGQRVHDDDGTDTT